MKAPTEETKDNYEFQTNKFHPLKITDKSMIQRMKYAESVSPLRGMTRTQKKKEIKMTEEEKELNRKILYNMNLKMNFVKNPRYKENPKIQPFSGNNFESIDSKNNPFFVVPKEVIFRDYQAGCVYQIDLKLLNRTQLLTSFRFVPPVTENFTIKDVIYPKKDSALIAPGMFAKMEILFNATSMENFRDEIVILTEKMAFKIPLEAKRDKPALSLINPMDCKKCFIGDRVEMHFTCKNNGGDAHFRFLPSDEEDQNEDQNAPTNELLCVGPFTVFPQEFYLYKGMLQNITVNFSPDQEGIIEKKLNLICENTNLSYVLRGEGIKVDIAIKKLDGLDMERRTEKTEVEEKEKDVIVSEENATEEEKNESFEKITSNDISDDKNEKLSTLFFEDTFPHTSTSRVLVLQNTSSVPIKYHWTIYDVYHQNEFSMLPEDNFFTIEPEDGVFEPFQELSFTIHFTPLNSKIYEQKLDLVIENIPFPAIKQFTANSSTIKNTFTRAEPYLPGFNSSFPSYPLYSFNLHGKGRLPYLEADKSYIDLGDVYVGMEVRDTFTISNPKTGVVNFKIKKIIQKLIKKKEDDNGINNFFKDNYLDDEVIFKNRITLQQSTVKRLDDVNSREEYKTNLEHTNVDYLNLVTQDFNFAEQIQKNQVGFSTTNSLSVENTMQKLKKKKSTISSTKQTMNNSNTITEAIKFRPVVVDEFIQIKQNQMVNFELTVKGDKLGFFKSSIIFSLDDGLSFSVDICANIIGPTLAVNTPFIDFGLFPVSQIQKQSFEIENTSPIPLTYLIKETRYAITLQNYKDKNYIEEFEGEIRPDENVKKNKIDSLIDYDNQDMLKFDIEKNDSYKMKFSSCLGVLGPFEKKIIDVFFTSPYPIQIEKNSTIEVMVEDSSSNYINYTVQCEEAFAYIENTMIIPKEIFLTMPIVANNNTITIVNPSNLPVSFKWDNLFEADKITAEFEPNSGTIMPHSKQEIKFKIIYFFIDHIDDLFVCHINEMDIPLGVVVQGDVIGLDIAYELLEESYELIKNINNGAVVGQSTVGDTGQRVAKRKKTRLSTIMEGEKAQEEIVDLKLSEINIKNLKVNSPAEIFFKIKNLSGIPTQFNLVIANYPPGKEKVIKVDKDQTTTNITKLSKISKKTYKNGNFKIDHLLLTAAHEEVNFTSAKGAEFTKMKQIEKDSILYLSNKKGVAIVVEPKKGHLVPHGECTIKVSFFNECVGEFHDILSSNVKGLATVQFPIDLRIKGNPLQLSPFQPGINYLLDPPFMKMGNILRNTGMITKHVKLVNIGTNTIALDWKIYDYEDYLKPKQRNIFNIKINEKTRGKFSLNFQAASPNEFPPDKQYYTISPEHAVIGPKETFDFTITFKTDTEGQKNALFIAYPKIEGDREGKVTFNELPLKVMACGLKPHLTVDKNLNMEGKYVYKFYVHSYGKHPKPKRPIILINKEKINMIVTIDVEGPFNIERTEPVEATMDKNVFNIIPNSNLKLDIKFNAPSPTNEKEWPMIIVNEKHGKMTVTFENGEKEEYYLKAILKRPRILLSLTGNESIESSDMIDFGYVNCASKKIQNLYLMNETDVDTNWKINYVKFVPKAVYGYGTITKGEKEDMEMLDDPSVFNFDVSEGVIYGPSDMLIDLPLGPALPKVEVEKIKKFKPLNIKVMFTPKVNKFYKCRYKIITSTGNTIDFLLKGNGSYLEEHIIE